MTTKPIQRTPVIPASHGIVSLLVVDDSVVQRQHALQLAKTLGVVHLHEACDGLAALAMLDRLEADGHQVDAMLIDLEMPIMDGVQLVQKLSERSSIIPFVVASTRELALIEGVATMASALGRPAAGILRKPFDQSALLGALERCAPGRPERKRMGASTTASIDVAALTQAISSGQIVPHYQPKVDVRTGLLRGVEVLSRWHDPACGYIPPDAFIPVAEREGQIWPLTLSILNQSLAQLASWRQRGLDLSIAVNLSPSLLSQADLVEQIGAQLLRHGVRPEQVMLEITESSVVAYQGSALGALARLRMQGYGLSIDDFGTGFSSMQQLARIPFTELKIDRSFVDGAHRQNHLRVILQSAIEMGKRLSIISVAEGVETMEDWALLQGLGCGQAQGWLIGKAMPGDDIPVWLKQHVTRLPQLRQSRNRAARGGAPTAPTKDVNP